MSYINKKIAEQMESCIKQSHIEVTRQYVHGQTLEVAGGAACFSGFDSYLSQVVAWGFASKPRQFESEINKIEQFYQGLQHSQVDIELCPYVGNSLAVFLSERGYGISELNNVSVLDLLRYQETDIVTDHLVVRALESNELGDWAKKIAIGFGYPEAQEQFAHYIRAKGISAFGVYDNNQLIAGATIAMHGQVCDLGVTSTLPAYRGKGLHKKLLFARLNIAKQKGLTMATVTTEPGTISDLNIQKVGFLCAYTRIKLTRYF